MFKNTFLQFQYIFSNVWLLKIEKNEASFEYWLGFEKMKFRNFWKYEKACQGASAKMNKE